MASKRKMRRFGDMKHRKWYKGQAARGLDAGWRNLSAKIMVKRVGDTGESKVRPYRAIACVGNASRKASGFYPRRVATRCGEARGKTPTQAIRGAFKDLGKVFK